MTLIIRCVRRRGDLHSSSCCRLGRYGYVFAAAEQSIDTTLKNGIVQYTDATSAAPYPRGPAIIHYGLHCHVNEYHFTKCAPAPCRRTLRVLSHAFAFAFGVAIPSRAHAIGGMPHLCWRWHCSRYDYGDFNINACGKHFFKPPQRPSARQELCAETINWLNDALCDFYRKQCPGAEELQCAPHVQEGDVCEDTLDSCVEQKRSGILSCNREATLKQCRHSCTGCCGDGHPSCLSWAFGGECERNPGFMHATCKASCNLCGGGADKAVPLVPKASQLQIASSLHSPPPPPSPTPPPPLTAVARRNADEGSLPAKHKSGVMGADGRLRDPASDAGAEGDVEGAVPATGGDGPPMPTAVAAGEFLGEDGRWYDARGLPIKGRSREWDGTDAHEIGRRDRAAEPDHRVLQSRMVMMWEGMLCVAALYCLRRSCRGAGGGGGGSGGGGGRRRAKGAKAAGGDGATAV